MRQRSGRVGSLQSEEIVHTGEESIDDLMVRMVSQVPIGKLASQAPGAAAVRQVSTSPMAVAMKSSVANMRRSIFKQAESPTSVGISLASWILGIALLAFSLYAIKDPVFTAGAFNFATPVRREQPAAAAHFREARAMSVSSLDLSNRLATGAANRSQGYVWKRIVLTYRGRVETRSLSELGRPSDGEVAWPPVSLHAVHSFEESLRRLPAWQTLCNESVPEPERRLCEVGDSLAAAAFGAAMPVSPEGEKQGVFLNVSLLRSGSFPAIPLPTVMSELRRSKASALKRWLPSYDEARVETIEALRSTFAFYLPQDDVSERWAEFIQDEVEGALVAGQQAATSLHIFYDIDDVMGLEAREFSRSLMDDLPFLLLGPIAASVATLVTTQRMMVALTAGLISVVAPVTASIGLARSGPGLDYDERKSAVPAVAFAAWNVVAVACADLGAATVRATEVLIPGVREPRREDRRTDARIYMTFANEVISPQLITAIALLVVSAATAELPLLSEFAWHTGFGLLMASIFAFVLLPQAVLWGDLIGRRFREHVKTMPAIRQSWLKRFLYTTCACAECGARQPWKRGLQLTVSTFAKEVMSSMWLRMLTLGACAVVAVVAMEFGYLPEIHNSTPQLFLPEHRITAGRVTRALFEQPLPEPDGILRDPLGYLHECTVDAFDSVGCSAYRCDVMRRWSAAEGPTCDCHHQSSDARTCSGTVARLFGEGARESVVNESWWAGFWQWTQTRLQAAGSQLDPSRDPTLDCGEPHKCSTVPERGGALALEDWRTGGSFDQDSVESRFVANASKRPPAFEEACNRVLCFCSEAVCDMEVSPDKSEYPPKVFGGQWKRLCEETDKSQSCSISLPKGESAGGARRLASEGGGREIDVHIIFGIFPPTGIPTWASGSLDNLQFDAAYMPESLVSQRAALAFCEGTHPALRIRSRSCWPERFRRWLALRGKRYPVPPEDFYDLLRTFFQELSEQPEGSTTQADIGRFWVGQDGKLLGFYSSFTALEPEGSREREEFFDMWQKYVAVRNRMLPPTAGRAWVVLPAAVLLEELHIISFNAILSIGLLVGLIAFFALVCTCSKGVALSVVVAMFFSLVFFGALAVGLGHRAVGTVEAVMVIAYLACLAVPVFRVAAHYGRAKEGPGLDPNGSGPLVDATVAKWQLPPDNDWKLLSMSYVPIARNDKRARREALPVSAYEILLWPGAIAAERKARTASCVTRSADSFFAGALGAALTGPGLLATSMQGLGQVGLVIFGGYITALPVALGLLPVLFEVGCGPSRVRRKARRIFRTWYRNGAPDSRGLDLLLEQGKDVANMDGGLASEILGWPYTILARQARFDADDPEMQTSMVSRMSRCLGCLALFGSGWRSEVEPTYSEIGGGDGGDDHRGSFTEDVPDESEAQILALDVHGATAMPPYHMVMEVRDRFEVAG